MAKLQLFSFSVGTVKIGRWHTILNNTVCWENKGTGLIEMKANEGVKNR